MIDLTNDIECSSLRLTSTERYNENIRIFHADYLFSNGIQIAKYIFVTCDSDTFKQQILEQEDFVRAIVEPVFYELRNDLSWNLYLVCVLSDTDYEKVSIEDRVRFSNNKDYTRNIFIKHSKFKQEIPVGRIVSMKETEIIENPIDSWRSILMTENLDFCLDGFSSDLAEKYANDIKLLLIPNEDVSAIRSTPTIKKINKINVTEKFRPNCYGRSATFDTRAANLLSGPNGTGKTTFLQTIESVLTGEVRIAKDNLSDSDANADINIEYNDGEILSPCTTTATKKERESAWYKNRESLRAKAGLNSDFHLYNHFSSEDTFLFAFADSQPAYDALFTKMLFGEDVKSAERSFESFRGKFESIKKIEENTKASIVSEIQSLTRMDSIDKDELVQKLNKLQIKYNPVASVQDWRNQILTLQSHCTLILDISNDITSQEKLDVAIAALENLTVFAKNESQNIRSEIEKLDKSLENDTSQLNAYKADNDNISMQMQDYQKIFNSMKKLEFINSKFDMFEKASQLNEQRTQLLKNVSTIESYYLKYKDLMGIEWSYSEVCTCAEKLSSLTLNLQQACELSSDLLKKLNKSKSDKSHLDNAISNIRSYGKQYIDSVKEFEGCPLCGNTRITRDEFVEFLSGEFEASDIELHDLQIEYDSLNNNIVELEKQIDTAKACQLWKVKIDEAYKNCVQDTIKDQTIDLLKAVKQTLAIYPSLLVEDKSVKESYDTEVMKIKSSGAGFQITADEINNYIKIVSDTESLIPQYNVDILLTKKERISKIIAYLNQKQAFFDSQKTSIDKKILETTSFISAIKTQLEPLNDKIGIIEKQIKLFESQKRDLDRIQEFFHNVLPMMKNGITYISHAEIYNQCCVLIDRFAEFLKAQEVSARKAELDEKIQNCDKLISNSKRAIDTIEKLEPSSKFANKFIQQHIDHFSNVFCSLHTPKEFQCLQLVDNKIVGIKNDSQVEINQMSTGQKTAVVLAIFISLNSAMNTAPNFILLDEPVANIDDLNILSLLDFLREMVITNEKQLFLTTANYNVKKLFRRKFSFLGDEFIEFEFDRISGEKANINIKQYTLNGLSGEVKRI